jgi:hypothetical protein
MNQSISKKVHLVYDPSTKTLVHDRNVPAGPSGNPHQPRPVFGGRTPFTDSVLDIRKQLLSKGGQALNLKLVSEVDGGAALLTRFDGAVMSGYLRQIFGADGSAFQENNTGEVKLDFEGWVLKKVRQRGRDNGPSRCRSSVAFLQCPLQFQVSLYILLRFLSAGRGRLLQ